MKIDAERTDCKVLEGGIELVRYNLDNIVVSVEQNKKNIWEDHMDDYKSCKKLIENLWDSGLRIFKQS